MLKAALTTEEFGKLDDSTKAMYAEAGSIYLLQVETATIGTQSFSLEDIGGLKKTLADWKSKAEKRAEQLTAFDGIDVAAAKSALEKVKQYTDIEGMKDEKLRAQAKAIEEQLEAKYAKEIEKLRTDNKTAQVNLEKAISDHGQSHLRSEALRCFGANKVIPDFQDVMLDKVRAVTKVKPDGNGGFKIEVLHSDGTPRITNKQNSTDPMSLDELIGTEFRNSPALSVCYEGANASGSGAGGSSGRGGAGGRHVISRADASDALKYRTAKAAADKAGVSLTVQ